MWLDRGCQPPAAKDGKLTDSLVCLPIYLAGCQSLLVLLGKSYTSRLWCVVEVSNFLVCTRATLALYRLLPTRHTCLISPTWLFAHAPHLPHLTSSSHRP